MQKKQNKWILDLDTIFDFIFTKEDKDVNVNIEEIMTPDGEGNIRLNSKKIQESKLSDHSNHETLRYDFLKGLIDNFNDVEFDKEFNNPEITTTFDELAFNTLCQYGYIKQI